MSQSTFGKYRLLAELGHGGMADVFLAVAQGPEGLGFTKLVVVKRLRQNLAEDPEFIAMLVDEARIAARLNHPNAVQTYEIGQVNDDYFIAMEYLDGQPMNRIANRGKKNGKELPLAYHLSILADVCAGLHHAHELLNYDGTRLGIVHRDVSPHNVFVTYDGQVKLVDFGIAKAAGRSSETKAGTVKGKVVYMAPEQASGQDVDHRADVFSVGVMMWEALTGARMWQGFDELGVMARLITRDLPGPPSTALATVDPVLDAICKRAIAPRVADRYETADEMASDILGYLNSKGQRPLQRDLGAFVSELFDDRRRETREVIDAQLNSLEKLGSTFKIRELSVSDSAKTPHSGRMSTAKMVTDLPLAETAPALAALAADAEEPGATRLVDSSPKATPILPAAPSAPQRHVITLPAGPSPLKKPRRLMAGIGLGALLGAGVGAYAVLHAASAAAPAAVPQAASVTSAASQPPQEAMIGLSFSSDVPGTSFRIDGSPPLPSPYATRVKKDDTTHILTAVAPNHEEARYDVRFDADVSWTPRLKSREVSTTAANAAGANPRRPTGAPGGRPTASATPQGATAAPPATAAIIGTPRGESSGRAKRVVDEENPYEPKKATP